MRFVIQRVLESSVKVDDKVIGKIEKGFMVLIGVGQNDTKKIANKITVIKKIFAVSTFIKTPFFTIHIYYVISIYYLINLRSSSYRVLYTSSASCYAFSVKAHNLKSIS